MSNLTYLMLCEHKKVKLKLVAWAYDCRYGHSQGFEYRVCCATCGKDISRYKQYGEL